MNLTKMLVVVLLLPTGSARIPTSWKSKLGNDSKSNDKKTIREVRSLQHILMQVVIMAKVILVVILGIGNAQIVKIVRISAPIVIIQKIQLPEVEKHQLIEEEKELILP